MTPPVPALPDPALPPPAGPDPAGPDPALSRPVTVADPAGLVAAVPVLLGFRPRESLVVIALGGPSGRRVGLTLRADLPPPDDPGGGAVRAVAARLAGHLTLDEPDAAAVVLFGGGSGPGGPGPGAAAAARCTCDALEAVGIEVRTVLWAAAAERGAPWACLGRCGCSGTLPDPSATATAAAAAGAGQVLYRDRAELERLVAAGDPARIRRREALLRRSVARRLDRLGALAEPGPGVRAGPDPFEVLETALRDAAAGNLALSDERVLALADALAGPGVRDAVLRRCVGDADGSGSGAPPVRAAAETLWAALCRELPDPEAAEPAALLAVCALLRGDGALANVALDRAERSWPGHRLTRLVRAVASAGLRPSLVREAIIGRAVGAGRPRSASC